MSTTPDSTTTTTGTGQDDAHEPLGHDDDRTVPSSAPVDDGTETVSQPVTQSVEAGDGEGAVEDDRSGSEPADDAGELVASDDDGERAGSDDDGEVAASDDDGELAGSDDAPSPTSSRDRTEDLVREGEIAADFLEALLDIADLAGDLEVDIEGNRAAVAIVDSEDGVAPRRLVGPGGAVLDALQELTRLAVQAETGERSRLMLDVAGYRSDRRSALVKTARRAIEEVKQSGSPRELEPMTAFERKVVHDEVLAAGLHSESEGVEPSRYVVIQPSA